MIFEHSRSRKSGTSLIRPKFSWHAVTQSFICACVRKCGSHTDETLRMAKLSIKIQFTYIQVMFSNLASLRVDEWRSSLIATATVFMLTSVCTIAGQPPWGISSADWCASPTNALCQSNHHTNICRCTPDATFHESPAVFCLSEHKIVSCNVVLLNLHSSNR